MKVSIEKLEKAFKSCEHGNNDIHFALDSLESSEERDALIKELAAARETIKKAAIFLEKKLEILKK